MATETASIKAILSYCQPPEIVRGIPDNIPLKTTYTRKEIFDLFGEPTFDYDALRIEFKKICQDFGNEHICEVPSLALHFAIEVIYKILPVSNALAETAPDYSWRLLFVDKLAETRNILGFAWIVTCRKRAPPSLPPTVRKGKIILTVKQASLLAIETLSMFILHHHDRQITLMTPFSRAIFAKEDITRMSQEVLAKDEVTNAEVAKIIVSITQSTQPSGHYLPASDCSIAVVCAFSATRNIKTKILADTIIARTFEQYVLVNKFFDKNMYKIYAKYATGGIPVDFSENRINKLIKNDPSTFKRVEIRKTELVHAIGPEVRAPLNFTQIKENFDSIILGRYDGQQSMRAVNLEDEDVSAGLNDDIPSGSSQQGKKSNNEMKSL